MRPFLMGSETEYSISGRARQGARQPIAPESLVGVLLEAARKESRWMGDTQSNGGFFLEQGGRLYNEIHGHPEYATPEVSTPAEVAAYDKAGERILRRAGQRLERELGIDLSAWKANLGPIFPDRVTFGSHESYLCWARLKDVAPQMIPHLVSRTIYAGAGCLSAHHGGVGFELSQRARHLVCEVGEETTSNRAIFCTRIRKATDASRDGWTRVHLIAKDSQRSPFGIYLTFGATGLLFWLINHGHKLGIRLTIAEPVKAFRAISFDPWLRTRVRLADGRHLSAVEIQECYLAECESLLQQTEGPDWAPEVIRHWRETLEQLAQDPLKLARRLDPYLKLYIYTHELSRAGSDWKQFHRDLALLAGLRERYPDHLIRAILAENNSSMSSDDKIKYAAALAEMRAQGSNAGDRLRLVVKMQALELKYHELGGLYDSLADRGDVESVVLGQEEIERAVTAPPPGGRAAFRGASIKSHHGEPGWMCDWGQIMHSPSRTLIDMRDPFAANYQTTTLESPAKTALK